MQGRLYNEYALGSRIQYQVRVGESVFVVEKLRQQPFTGQLDDEVFIGWDAAGRHPGDGLDAMSCRPVRVPHSRDAFPAGGLRGAAARGDLVQLHAAAQLLLRRRADARELPHHLRKHELHFLPVVAGARGDDRRPAGAHLLSGGLWPGAGVRQMGHAGDTAVHHPALRLREHQALWLGAVPHQERRAARHAQVLVRRRAGEHAVLRCPPSSSAWSMSICPSCCSR